MNSDFLQMSIYVNNATIGPNFNSSNSHYFLAYSISATNNTISIAID